MRLHQVICGLILPIAIISCGARDEKENSTGEKKSAQSAKNPAPNNIHDVWLVTAKKCDWVPMPIKTGESYRIDSSSFVRMEQESKTETTVCKVAYLYNRNIGSFSATETYQESAILRSTALKRQCWEIKENGKIGQLLKEETSGFGPEAMGSKINFTSNKGTIELLNFRECPNGILILDVTKK
jgi:hypothetical protein